MNKPLQNLLRTIVSISGIKTIGFPITIVMIQAAFRYNNGLDFNNLGITLGALALGQIIIYLIFDHFITTKVIGFEKHYETQDNNLLSITFKAERKIATNKIRSIETLLYTIALIVFILFIWTVVLGLKGFIGLHIFSGILACFLTWYFILFIK